MTAIPRLVAVQALVPAQAVPVVAIPMLATVILLVVHVIVLSANARLLFLVRVEAPALLVAYSYPQGIQVVL